MLYKPTKFAMETEQLQQNYSDCWQSLQKHFTEIN
jgi:homogentisate 1,2-dioxygenase